MSNNSGIKSNSEDISQVLFDDISKKSLLKASENNNES